MEQTRSVLVVEDDSPLCALLCRHLRQAGWKAYGCADFSQVDQLVREYNPQIVLMDITLPQANGFFWTEKIRSFSTVPILFISSQADAAARVVALHQGADDYVVKPFSIDVLAARMEALCRRAWQMQPRQKIELQKGVLYDPDQGTIFHGEAGVELSGPERRILSILLRKRPQAVSRAALKMELWQTDEFISDGTLSTAISRLRKKLAQIGLDGCIETAIGQGYHLQ